MNAPRGAGCLSRQPWRLTVLCMLAGTVVTGVTGSLVQAQGQGQVARPDTGTARYAGTSDGRADGGREGAERGRPVGLQQGAPGYQPGYARCRRDELERQHELGVREGYPAGTAAGAAAGDARGEREGPARGKADGERDGDARANRTAELDAVPRGTQQGEREASQSDAPDKGRADGLAAAEKTAADRARERDYPRGRQAYRDERLAEAVVHREILPQRSIESSRSFTGSNPRNSAPDTSATPDNRYFNPRRQFATEEENSAYRSAYAAGYASGFTTDYYAALRAAASEAYELEARRGCAEALRLDYSAARESGRRDGTARGYQESFDRAYEAAFARTRDAAFRAASASAYNANYQRYFDRHFEAARARAYAERYREAYTASFTRARDEAVERLYVQRAQEEYARGRADEAAEFARMPLRIVSVDVTETNGNGLIEPGEPLRARLILRNFGDQAIAGRDVTFSASSPDDTGVVIEASAYLAGELKPRSVTDITEALEFRGTEAGAGKDIRFLIRVMEHGSLSGEATVVVTPRFALEIGASLPAGLAEGLERPMRLTIRNQTTRAIEPGARLLVEPSSDLLEIRSAPMQLPLIPPNDSLPIDVTTVVRATGPRAEISLSTTLTSSEGRRLAAPDLTVTADVINTYDLAIVNGIPPLRSAGTHRLEYQLTNRASDNALRSLQVIVRLLSADGKATLEGAAVAGPHPQLLSPIARTARRTFVVPVRVDANNTGGVMEIEIQEGGTAVLIRRVKF